MGTVEVYRERNGKCYLAVDREVVEIKKYTTRVYGDGNVVLYITMEGVPVSMRLTEVQEKGR